MADILESLLELDLLLNRLKYSPDQPRDDHGRFGEGTGSGSDPLEHVKFRIGTLSDKEQQVVRETLGALATKYPSVADQITSVRAVPLTTRWGSFNDLGRLQLTNIGEEQHGEEFKDPNLDATVAHEFGHALFRDMAGIEGPNERPSRDSDQATIREYNAMVRDQGARIDAVVTDLYRGVASAFDGDPEAIHAQLAKEFTENPAYIASNPQELLAQAFGHYETGQHGEIADLVGHAVEDHYGVRS